jgi:hypothetical protein
MVVTIFAKIALKGQWVKHNAHFICRNTKKVSESRWRGLSLRSNSKHMATVGFSERIYLQYLRTKFKTISKLAPSYRRQDGFRSFLHPLS